jgi:glycosyltransferase involved in cell wall biosynthesis
VSSGRRILFLSGVHPSPVETRIFCKEAKSLSAAGYEVAIASQHDKAEMIEGIRIIPMRRPRNRFDRMTALTWRLLRIALSEKADVYHLHDPALIPLGVALKILNRKVIYDAHEAYGAKIKSKYWIRPRLRPLVSAVYSFFERNCAKLFDWVIAADKFTASQFKGRRVSTVANYPLMGMANQVRLQKAQAAEEGNQVVILVYAGGLAKDRGLFVMLEALNHLSCGDCELHLLGKFVNPEEEAVATKTKRVRYFGFLPLEKVYEHLQKATIGLVLLQPVSAYLYAGENTTKLFEYMACGLPVIASNFPNLRQIVENSGCGVCVDPTNPQEIAKAIDFLCANPQVRAEMGKNGRSSVASAYNWEKESKTLLQVYQMVLDSAAAKG